MTNKIYISIIVAALAVGALVLFDAEPSDEVRREIDSASENDFRQVTVEATGGVDTITLLQGAVGPKGLNVYTKESVEQGDKFPDFEWGEFRKMFVLFEFFEFKDENGETIGTTDKNMEEVVMTMPNGEEATFHLSPDDPRWRFRVWENPSPEGKYVFRMKDKNGNLYKASTTWELPQTVSSGYLGNTKAEQVNGRSTTFHEFQIGGIDLSDAQYVVSYSEETKYGQEHGNYEDENFWFRATNQVPGKHWVLVKWQGEWFMTDIDYPEDIE